ncbi:hypothetical protein D3C80_1509060 [compost metagenome]
MEDVALALHVEAIHVAHHRQRFLQGHILQLHRDGTRHPGVHRHAVAGALEQGAEELDRIDIMGRDAQPLLGHRHRLRDPIQLQQFALHRGGQGGQGRSLVLLGHGLLEGILGLHRIRMLVGSTTRHRQREGKQA